MQTDTRNQVTQPKTRNAFTLINNVRDHCKQPPAKKALMLVLAISCDYRTGICWPGNDRLAAQVNVSQSTVKRLLSQLAKDGELEILTTGRGRNQRRKIKLTGYVGKPAPDQTKQLTAMTCLNRSYSDPLSAISDLPTLSTRDTHASALRASSTDYSLSRYDSEEREKLKMYRGLLSDIYSQFLPINKYSPRVSEVLELFDLQGMRELCEAAAWMIDNDCDACTHTRASGEKIDLYLPKANLRTGKLTLVRLIQCNRDNPMNDEIPI